MTNPMSESQPVTQRWMPQASIRFFLLLIGLSALVMFTVVAAIESDQFWAKCAVAVLATAIACFLCYAALFLIAYLIAILSTSLAEVPLTSPADNNASEGARPSQTPQGDVPSDWRDRDGES